MGLHHFAYTFDSERFHDALRRQVIFDDKLNVIALQHLAHATMNNAHLELKQTLNEQRYDDEWLDDPDGDQAQAYLWYTVVLSAELRRAPSLSNNRNPLTWYVLLESLLAAGWTEKDRNALVFGERLHEFLQEPEDRIFSDNLAFYSGGLNLKRVHSLINMLDASQEYFTSEVAEMNSAVADVMKHTELSASQILLMAYEDARDMLNSAIERNEALYLVPYW